MKRRETHCLQQKCQERIKINVFDVNYFLLNSYKLLTYNTFKITLEIFNTKI